MNNIADGHIVLPDTSIFKGLSLVFNGTPPEVGSPLTVEVTLPQYTATLSAAGLHDVVIEGVQNNTIEGPDDSVYKGLIFAYNYGSTSPLLMDGTALTTTLNLTRGIAVNFARDLAAATVRHQAGHEALSQFDLAVEMLLLENKNNQKEIETLENDAERQKKALEPLIKRLYAMNEALASITAILEKINTKKK